MQQVFWHSGFFFLPSFLHLSLHFCADFGFFVQFFILHLLTPFFSVSLKQSHLSSGGGTSQVVWHCCFFLSLYFLHFFFLQLFTLSAHVGTLISGGDGLGGGGDGLGGGGDGLGSGGDGDGDGEGLGAISSRHGQIRLRSPHLLEQTGRPVGL